MGEAPPASTPCFKSMSSWEIETESIFEQVEPDEAEHHITNKIRDSDPDAADDINAMR